MTSPVAAYTDPTGCHVPSADFVLSYLQAKFQAIYGTDITFDSSDQDTEWLGIIMEVVNDCNAAVGQSYNARSPATAQGTGLSSIVKINGITRKVASYSTVTLTIVGVAGTVLTNAIASDGTYSWALPPSVTIPFAGQIDVTATCTAIGAITAEAGTITELSTPTLGWQTVTNSAAASQGEPVETDPQLRVRQARSTMIPSQTVLDGLYGALLALPGVTRCAVLENDTNITDANGIPGHTVAVVIDGGDPQAIANTIALKKTPGGGTFGTAVQVVTSAQGVARNIGFFRSTQVPITYVIRIKALSGFTLDNEALLQQTMATWTNALGIGTDVGLADAYSPARLISTDDNGNLVQDPAAATYKLLSVAMARDGLTTAAQDVSIAFNEAPFCVSSYVQVVAS